MHTLQRKLGAGTRAKRLKRLWIKTSKEFARNSFTDLRKPIGRDERDKKGLTDLHVHPQSIRPVLCGSLLLLCLLSGCTRDKAPIELSLAQPSSTPPSESLSSEVSCSVVIDALSDDRLRQYDVGSINGRLITTANVHSWLNERFALLFSSFEGARLVSSPPGSSEFPFIRLSPTLKKMYLHTLPSTINATVLLKVDYSKDRQSLLTESYRGQVTNTFWYESADSYNEALNEALDMALTDVALDFRRLCSAQTSQVRSTVPDPEVGSGLTPALSESSNMPSALQKETREKFREYLGSVGIRSVSESMTIEIHTPARGWKEGAWAGVQKGASYGADFSFDVCRMIRECDDLECVAMAMALCGSAMVTFTTVGAVTGGMAGAVIADSADEVELAEEQTTTLLVQAEVRHALQQLILDHAKTFQREEVYPITEDRPDAYNVGSNLYFLPSGDVSTILRFDVQTMGLRAPVNGIDPDLQFFLTVQTQLFSKAGQVLDQRPFEYVSFPQTFDIWNEEKAKLLKQELELGMETIAQQIVKELLLGKENS